MDNDALIERFDKLDERMRKIEESVSMGRGALGMFMALLALIGTVGGLVKLFGK